MHRSFHNLLLDKRTSPHFLFYTNPVVGGEAEESNIMKRILFVLVLSFVSLCASAQTKTAYCDVYARGGGENMTITIMYNDTPYEIHPDENRSNLGNVLNELAADGWILDRDIVIPRHPVFSMFTRHKLHLIMKKEYQEGENPFLLFELKMPNDNQYNNQKNASTQSNNAESSIKVSKTQTKQVIDTKDEKLLVSQKETNGTWYDAIEYCKTLGEGWILPNKEQIDYICKNSNIKFSNCWTATEVNDNKAKAYYRGYAPTNMTMLKSTNNIGIIAIKVVDNDVIE